MDPFFGVWLPATSSPSAGCSSLAGARSHVTATFPDTPSSRSLDEPLRRVLSFVSQRPLHATFPSARSHAPSRSPNAANRRVAPQPPRPFNAVRDGIFRPVAPSSANSLCLPAAPRRQEGSDVGDEAAHSGFVMEMSAWDPEASSGARSVDRLNTAPLWLLDLRTGRLFVCVRGSPMQCAQSVPVTRIGCRAAHGPQPSSWSSGGSSPRASWPSWLCRRSRGRMGTSWIRPRTGHCCEGLLNVGRSRSGGFSWLPPASRRGCLMELQAVAAGSELVRTDTVENMRHTRRRVR